MSVAPVIRVGIVDDSLRDRSHILELLHRFKEEQGVTFQIRQFDDGAAVLENYQPDFDILFLDIKMEGIDGMKAATAIRRVDTAVALVFVTNTAQYATTGYSVAAQSYLLKPVSYFAFKTEMQRFLDRHKQTERSSILVGSGTALRRVDIPEILYLESNRHKLTVFTTGEEITFLAALKTYEQALEGRNFYRANSGYLINLQHLKAIDGENAVMSNGDVLKVSRSRKKGLLEALTEYIGRQLM